MLQRFHFYLNGAAANYVGRERALKAKEEDRIEWFKEGVT